MIVDFQRATKLVPSSGVAETLVKKVLRVNYVERPTQKESEK